MPTVQKTTGNTVVIRGVGRFERGDTADVSEEIATYLVKDRGDFAYASESEQDEPADDEDEEPQPEEDETDERDDEGFDADAWLEEDFGDRADRVRAGEVDGHLDAIAEAETSDTVRDAIGERRAELEG